VTAGAWHFWIERGALFYQSMITAGRSNAVGVEAANALTS
jgi:hypothetical protein